MILLYAISFIFLVSVIAISLKQSELGILVLLAELPFVIGICLYPLLFEGGFVLPGIEGQSYLDQNAPPGWGAAVHVLCYSLFAAVGYFVAANSSFIKPNIMERALARIAAPVAIWRFLVLYGLVIYGIYFLLVGLDVALINAAAARSGDFEGFGDSDKFLFLKTLASLSGYAACFLPYVLLKKRSWLFLGLYIMLTIIVYLNTISRSLVLMGLISPLLVAMRAQRFKIHKTMSFIALIAPIAYFVLFFGKGFGYFMSSYLSSGEIIELAAHQGEEGLWNSFFRHYEFVWFSVDAGWLWFANNGPWIPIDALMAVIGFIPSRVLDAFNIGWLYYGSVDNQMACVNSTQFGVDSCTVPPLITGVSAYMAPVLGAMIAGFIKYFAYGRLEKTWIYFKKTDYSKTWIPYFLFMLLSAFTSFIPGIIAASSFAVVMVFLVYGLRVTLPLMLFNKTRNFR